MASESSSELPPSTAGPSGVASDHDNADGPRTSSLNRSSLDYVEELYLQYLSEPDSLAEGWRDYFAALGPEGMAARHLSASPSTTRPGFASHSLFNPPSGASASELDQAGVAAAVLQQKLDRLVRNYRVRGHRLAELSPL